MRIIRNPWVWLVCCLLLSGLLTGGFYFFAKAAADAPDLVAKEKEVQKRLVEDINKLSEKDRDIVLRELGVVPSTPTAPEINAATSAAAMARVREVLQKIKGEHNPVAEDTSVFGN